MKKRIMSHSIKGNSNDDEESQHTSSQRLPSDIANPLTPLLLSVAPSPMSSSSSSSDSNTTSTTTTTSVSTTYTASTSPDALIHFNIDTSSSKDSALDPEHDVTLSPLPRAALHFEPLDDSEEDPYRHVPPPPVPSPCVK